jgi:hypothetical protein
LELRLDEMVNWVTKQLKAPEISLPSREASFSFVQDDMVRDAKDELWWQLGESDMLSFSKLVAELESIHSRERPKVGF